MTLAVTYPTTQRYAGPAALPRPTVDEAHSAEERVWIERALAGDQSAFAALVERYQTAVYNLCYRMLGGAAEGMHGGRATALERKEQIRRTVAATRTAAMPL